MESRVLSPAEIKREQELQKIINNPGSESIDFLSKALKDANIHLTTSLRVIDNINISISQPEDSVSDKQDKIGEHTDIVQPIIQKLEQGINNLNILLKANNTSIKVLEEKSATLANQYNLLKQCMTARKSQNLDILPSLESLPSTTLFIVLGAILDLHAKDVLIASKFEQEMYDQVRKNISISLGNITTVRNNDPALRKILNNQNDSFKKADLDLKTIKQKIAQLKEQEINAAKAAALALQQNRDSLASTVKKDSPSNSSNQAGKNSNSKSSEESKDSPPKMGLHADLSHVDDILEQKENFFNDDQPGAPKQGVQTSQSIKYNPQVRAIFQNNINARVLPEAQPNRSLSSNAQLQNVFNAQPASPVQQIQIKAKQEIDKKSEDKSIPLNPLPNLSKNPSAMINKLSQPSQESLLEQLANLEKQFIAYKEKLKITDYANADRVLAEGSAVWTTHIHTVKQLFDLYSCSYPHITEKYPELLERNNQPPSSCKPSKCSIM